MITQITGRLNRVLDDEVRLQVGALEYQVLVPEFVRRQVQMRIGEELKLHTNEYLEGNPMQGRVVPRFIGFLTEAELEFFELFCTVDKVGVRKAIKALVDRDLKLAFTLREDDAAINRLEVEIEEACISLLARYQPEAKDLRAVAMIFCRPMRLSPRRLRSASTG